MLSNSELERVRERKEEERGGREKEREEECVMEKREERVRNRSGIDS